MLWKEWCCNVGTKVGRGRKAFRKIGKYRNEIDIGIRLDQNNTNECIQMVFKRENRSMGFLLMEMKNDRCSFRGMKVEMEFRGMGYSSVFMGIWLLVCSHLGIEPDTNRIDKPLLSLLLARFGFSPRISTQVLHIGTRHNQQLTPIWSPNGKSALSSMFSNRDLSSMLLYTSENCPSDSEVVYVKTEFYIPCMSSTMKYVYTILPDSICKLEDLSLHGL